MSKTIEEIIAVPTSNQRGVQTMTTRDVLLENNEPMTVQHLLNYVRVEISRYALYDESIDVEHLRCLGGTLLKLADEVERLQSGRMSELVRVRKRYDQ
jgi:hypothetical protein